MVYVMLANGFEEIDAIEPIDILRRGGADVTTVSVTDTQYVTGAHNIRVCADILIKDVNKDDMEMIMLPGGAGHTILDASDEVHKLIDFAFKNDRFVTAICASPSIIGKMGILDGKNATCYPGFEEFCHGAIMTHEKAVKDGKIITGRGPGAAAEFGFELLKALKGEYIANTLRQEMQYND